MSRFSDFKHVFVTDDGEPSKPAPTKPAASAPAPAFDFSKLNTTHPTSVPTTGSMSAYPSPYGAPPVEADPAVYQGIYDKTDFEKTTTAATIHKYLDAMSELPLDQNTKFKTAMAQAAKLEGLTADKVLATFDSMRQTLADEADKFARAVDGKTQKEIVGRQTRQQQVRDQIAQLQQEDTKLTGELSEQTGKISNATTQFQMANQRRGSEIDAQKAQFAALLR